MSPTALRVLTALVLLATLVAVLFLLPEWVWSLTVLLLSVVAATEWARLCRWTALPRLLFAAAVGLAVAMPALGFDAPSRLGPFLGVLAAIFWCVVAPLTLWRAASGVGLRGFAGAMVLLPLAWSLLWLHRLPDGAWLLVAGMAFVWIADSAAYFAGRAWGRHRLAPSISPGKTWEGVVGALAGTLAYAALLSVYAGAAVRLDLVQLLILAVILTVLSVIGDLYESWMKRLAGVKDSGRCLPGHGGLLDRVDGLAAALPAWAAALWLAGWSA